MEQQAVDDFVHMLYGAVIDAELWPGALSRMAALADAPRASLMDSDFAAGVVFRALLHGIDDDDNQVYLQKFASIDPRISVLLGSKKLSWLSDFDYFDDAFRKNDRFYQEYLQPRGAGETLGLTCAREGSRLGTCTLIRDVIQGRFVAAQIRALDFVAPHIDRAIRMSRRFAAVVSKVILGHAVLDSLDEPLACVLHDGRLHHANRAFDDVLRSGRIFSGKQGMLRIADPSAHARFLRAIRECCHIADGSVGSDPNVQFTIRVDQPTGLPVFLTTVPLTNARLKSWANRPCALVRVHEQVREIAPEILMSALDLTPAEARLVSALCSGGTLAFAAERLGISLNTAKSQLASVFSKSGTARQSELMALVTVLPRQA